MVQSLLARGSVRLRRFGSPLGDPFELKRLRLALRECCIRSSRSGAWTPRHGSVPAGQMGKLWSYLYLCQTATNIDCDQRSDVGDGEAVAGNESMPV
jgi:hypothetical protein